MRYVYDRKKDDLESTVLIPEMNYIADTQADPFLRYYLKDYARKYTDDSEREYRLVHNLSQAIRFNILEVGSEKASIIMDARIKSADDENQPDITLRQMFYKYTDIFKVIKEVKVGRVLSTQAAGMSNYDGAQIYFKFGNFYYIAYGGMLLDNDYLQKDTEKCLTYPPRNSCYGGTSFENEDYDNKWEATDVRNASSKERSGDTIAGSSAGFKFSKLKFELDYQKKTDDLHVTEELGGVNIFSNPIDGLDIYSNVKGDLINKNVYSGLAGIAWMHKNWRYIPEYEYYKPHFKEGSFWENFHTFARSAARVSVYRFQGRKLQMHASAGKLFYLDDNSKSENLTTDTIRDPVTGEITGTAYKANQRIPVLYVQILGYPYTVNPLTGAVEPVASRDMSLVEILIYNELRKSQSPEDGAEGEAGFKYSTNFSLRWGIKISTIQGPEGIVNKATANFALPFRKFHFLMTMGQAYFKDIESKTGNEKATYMTFNCRYRFSTSIEFQAGVENYSDTVYRRDTRGLLGFRYAF